MSDTEVDEDVIEDVDYGEEVEEVEEDVKVKGKQKKIPDEVDEVTSQVSSISVSTVSTVAVSKKKKVVKRKRMEKLRNKMKMYKEKKILDTEIAKSQFPRSKTVPKPKKSRFLREPPRVTVCRNMSFPNEPIGYRPSLEDVLRERRDKFRREGVDILPKMDLRKEVLVQSTRFLPVSAKVTHDEDVCRDPADMVKMYTEKTQNRCFNCHTSCDCVPLPFPEKFDLKTGQFTVFGTFCSKECLMSHAVSQNKTSLTRHMLAKIYGVGHEVRIDRALPFYFQKEYGGFMDRESYRYTGSDLSIKKSVVSLPFIPMRSGLEEVQSMKMDLYEMGVDEAFVKNIPLRVKGFRPMAVSQRPEEKTQKKDNREKPKNKTKKTTKKIGKDAPYLELPSYQEQVSRTSSSGYRVERSRSSRKKKKRISDYFV
jgi:hypothetical protein